MDSTIQTTPKQAMETIPSKVSLLKNMRN